MAQRRGFMGRFRDQDDDRARDDDGSYRTHGEDDDRDHDWRSESWRSRRARLRDADDQGPAYESRRPSQWPQFGDRLYEGQARDYGQPRFTQGTAPQPTYGQFSYAPSTIQPGPGTSIYPQSHYPSTFIEHHTGLGYGQGQTMFGGGATNSGFAQVSAPVPFYAHPHGPFGGPGAYGPNPPVGPGPQASPGHTDPSPYQGSGAHPAQGATHYGASSTASGHEHDYSRWRHEQLKKLDSQYQTWRDSQARQFDDDFARYSQNRHADFSARFEDWRKQNEGSQPQTGGGTGTHGAASGLGASSGTQGWQNIGTGYTTVTGVEGASAPSGPTTNPAVGPAAKAEKSPSSPPKH